MRYYAQYDSNNKLIAIGIGIGITELTTEITEAEYSEFLTIIRKKASLVSQLYNNEITISDIPVEWQEEIQRRVDKRIASEEEMSKQPISSEEFYTMLEEVL